MARTRLPRPGEVKEQCRLCGAGLALTLENPRRVCGGCGEVNLPGELAPIETVRSAQRPPAPMRLWEVVLPLVLALPVAPIFWAVLSASGRGNTMLSGLKEGALAAGAAMVVSLGVLLATLKSRDWRHVPPSLIYWCVGLAAGVFIPRW